MLELKSIKEEVEYLEHCFEKLNKDGNFNPEELEDVEYLKNRSQGFLKALYLFAVEFMDAGLTGLLTELNPIIKRLEEIPSKCTRLIFFKRKEVNK